MSIQRNKIIATNREHPGYINALVDALEDPLMTPVPNYEEFEYALSGKNSRPIPGKKIGRNELCPCGSGKKYKHCCGR